MITMPLMQNYGSELSPDIINTTFRVWHDDGTKLIDNEVWCAGIRPYMSRSVFQFFITPDCVYMRSDTHFIDVSVVSYSYINNITRCRIDPSLQYFNDMKHIKSDTFNIGNANVVLNGINFISYISPEGIDFCGPRILIKKDSTSPWEPMFALFKKHAGGSFQPLIDNGLNRRMIAGNACGPCMADSWNSSLGILYAGYYFYNKPEYNTIYLSNDVIKCPPFTSIFHPNAFKSVSIHRYKSFCSPGIHGPFTLYDSVRKKSVTGIVVGDCSRTEFMIVFRL